LCALKVKFSRRIQSTLIFETPILSTTSQGEGGREVGREKENTLAERKKITMLGED